MVNHDNRPCPDSTIVLHGDENRMTMCCCCRYCCCSNAFVLRVLISDAVSKQRDLLPLLLQKPRTNDCRPKFYKRQSRTLLLARAKLEVQLHQAKRKKKHRGLLFPDCATANLHLAIASIKENTGQKVYNQTNVETRQSFTQVRVVFFVAQLRLSPDSKMLRWGTLNKSRLSLLVLLLGPPEQALRLRICSSVARQCRSFLLPPDGR